MKTSKRIKLWKKAIKHFNNVVVSEIQFQKHWNIDRASQITKYQDFTQSARKKLILALETRQRELTSQLAEQNIALRKELKEYPSYDCPIQSFFDNLNKTI